MKRYKYRALVRLNPQHDADPGTALPGPTCRVVVRAQHHDTHRSKIFSALVSTPDDVAPAEDFHIPVTMVVLGDDAGDYLAPGERFALWRGGDVAAGVVTGRIFV